MKISACVIVKNEADNISRWLENMQPVADDIVVVDTGSADNTVEIVKSYGIEPYYFAWCNDFAAAKNYAIAQAKGDWILFLDADEYFTRESLQVLRNLLERYHKDKKVGAILCRLIDIDRDNMGKVIGDMLQVRIFRNDSKICFVGAVHEQLHTAGRYIMQYCRDLEIYHTGYSSSLIRQKAERNLSILEKMEKEAENQEKKNHLYPYLMDACHALGQYDGMLKYATLSIESNTYVLGEEDKAYKSKISALASLGRDSKEIMAAVDEALERFPGDTFFLVEKGHFYYVDRSYLRAQPCLEDALRSHRKLERQMAAGAGMTDSALGILPLLYGELADIYLLQGKKSMAEELSLKGLTYHKYNRLLTRCLYRAVSHRDMVEIIQRFNAIYDRSKDSDYLMEVLSMGCRPEFAAYYGVSCRQDRNRLKVFLRTKCYLGAAALASRNLRIYSKFSEYPR